MLIISHWTLQVANTTLLPCSYPLELVKLLHNKLGLEMGTEKITSVSCSTLCGLYKTSGDFFIFQPGEIYRLSLAGLQEKASRAIKAIELKESIKFLGTQFNIIEREDKITSYEKLYTDLIANEPESPKQFNLQFFTPTAFAQNRTILPLPVPTLMFRSWLEKWNHFAPIYLGGDELIAYLDNAFFLKQHKIQTRRVYLQQSSVSGFVGYLTLKAFNHTDPLLLNIANLLIEYARFSGTGIKTRLGMGQTNISSWL
ncbi:MAG: CRISPR system precrRNA processing endoribonuclease RAMP protein Cas6 [Microcystis flos-aquae TF09]|uniref:CRISPR system precrRNA processing endoribonuclease RAMP protein Cas6 n=1 Tax=Microcystis flos-aquae TF09 TaxID=2060473 RepID=A0A3E0L624_9CHRO|nr:MAG: CRISPR system precrRNA processing endoribonuclease RAMP protein Cas6 [Microcystis flos-aquae TF09]